MLIVCKTIKESTSYLYTCNILSHYFTFLLIVYDIIEETLYFIYTIHYIATSLTYILTHIVNLSRDKSILIYYKYVHVRTL